LIGLERHANGGVLQLLLFFLHVEGGLFGLVKGTTNADEEDKLRRASCGGGGGVLRAVVGGMEKKGFGGEGGRKRTTTAWLLWGG